MGGNSAIVTRYRLESQFHCPHLESREVPETKPRQKPGEKKAREIREKKPREIIVTPFLIGSSSRTTIGSPKRGLSKFIG